jgi:hypothetical protein
MIAAPMVNATEINRSATYGLRRDRGLEDAREGACEDAGTMEVWNEERKLNICVLQWADRMGGERRTASESVAGVAWTLVEPRTVRNGLGSQDTIAQ